MKSKGRKLNVRAIIFLVALSLLANFFITPTTGVTDGIAGWPIVQADSSNDSSGNSTTYEEPETEESETSLLTLLWEAVKVLF